MSFLPERELEDAAGPFGEFRARFGFVPNLFRAQTLLPRVIHAEAGMAGAVLRDGALSERQKQMMLLTIAAAQDNTYCMTAHREMLRALGVPAPQLDRLAISHRRAGLPRFDVTLLEFGLQLTRRPSEVQQETVDALRRRRFTDDQIVEAVQVAALGAFLCTLAVGLGAAPDVEPATPRWTGDGGSGRRVARPPARGSATTSRGSVLGFLAAVEPDTEARRALAFFQERFGFMPNIFRAQAGRPDVLAAEAQAVETILLSGDVLSRVQKEYLLLRVSAANLNTYCVAVHGELLQGLGVPVDRSDRIAVDHRAAGLARAEVALLDFALTLSQRPRDFGREDMDTLHQQGFTEAQILEAVVMTALTQFLNTLQVGLGVVPDVAPRHAFRPADRPPPSGVDRRPDADQADPDLDLVDRVRAGDLAAFEAIVHRYEGRLYRTLVGLTGSPEDAQEATQNAFLRAFKGLGRFQGASKFSTWLTRIAINEGLRKRKGLKGATVRDREDPEALRARSVEAWADTPEARYSRKEIQALVERALANLPASYRVVVILRDLEQVPAADGAAALGLSLAAFKSRLLRGRLLLREALAPHFATTEGSSVHA